MGLESLSVLLDPTGKMLLLELDKGVIENIRTNLISTQLKNQELSGNPEAGVVFVRRFANATSADYGTARAAGKGEALKGMRVEVPINIDKECITEIEQKDISLLGVKGIVEKRAENHKQVVAEELDTAFFKTSVDAATTYTPPATANTIPKQLENSILTLSTLKTNYVVGVPRTMISIVASEEYYSEIRDELDTMGNTGITTQTADFGLFHGVKVYHTANLPTGTDFITQVNGSVAQPVMVKEYKAERVQLSEAIAIELFYYYGTKAITPELIFAKKSA